MELEMKSYRRWHRWVGTLAAIFLAWASITGVIVAATEFFGADEAERERLRDVVSTYTLASPDSDWTGPIQRAVAAAQQRAPGAPVDKVELKLKGDAPTVSVFLGKPGGGENRRFIIDARNGTVLSEESYVDKPLWYRLHSGEAFGDGGLVVAMFWGLSLALMSVTGFLMYLHMLRRHKAAGWRRYFW